VAIEEEAVESRAVAVTENGVEVHRDEAQERLQHERWMETWKSGRFRTTAEAAEELHLHLDNLTPLRPI
jgi:hypothetical protein